MERREELGCCVGAQDEDGDMAAKVSVCVLSPCMHVCISVCV